MSFSRQGSRIRQMRFSPDYSAQMEGRLGLLPQMQAQREQAYQQKRTDQHNQRMLALKKKALKQEKSQGKWTTALEGAKALGTFAFSDAGKGLFSTLWSGSSGGGFGGLSSMFSKWF